MYYKYSENKKNRFNKSIQNKYSKKVYLLIMDIGYLFDIS